MCGLVSWLKRVARCRLPSHRGRTEESSLASRDAGFEGDSSEDGFILVLVAPNPLRAAYRTVSDQIILSERLRLPD